MAFGTNYTWWTQATTDSMTSEADLPHQQLHLSAVAQATDDTSLAFWPSKSGRQMEPLWLLLSK